MQFTGSSSWTQFLRNYCPFVSVEGVNGTTMVVSTELGRDALHGAQTSNIDAVTEHELLDALYEVLSEAMGPVSTSTLPQVVATRLGYARFSNRDVRGATGAASWAELLRSLDWVTVESGRSGGRSAVLTEFVQPNGQEEAYALPAPTSPVPERETETWLALLSPGLRGAVLDALGQGGERAVVELTLQVDQQPMLSMREGGVRHTALAHIPKTTASELQGVLRRIERAWDDHEARGELEQRFRGDEGRDLRDHPDSDRRRGRSTRIESLFTSDNRVGVPGTLHRVSAIRSRPTQRCGSPFSGLTLRVGRPGHGSSNGVLYDSDLTQLVNSRASLLLVGSPCMGKTTILRDLCRRMSARHKVVIVDTSMEIGGAGSTTHPCVGPVIRLFVPHRRRQAEVMLEAVMNHSPDVLVIDEISNRDEIRAARDISRRGVSMVATVHAASMAQLVESPDLVDLVGGRSTVPIGDNLAQDMAGSGPGAALAAKLQLMRREPPVFRNAVVLEHSTIEVELDVQSRVDELLRATGAAMARRSWE